MYDAASIGAVLAIIAPEFDSDPRRADVINIAIKDHEQPGFVFGDLYDPMLAYYCAHFLAMSPDPTGVAPGPGGGGTAIAGPITSKKTSKLAVGYGNLAGGAIGKPGVNGDDLWYLQTTYDQAYLSYRARCVVAPMIF